MVQRMDQDGDGVIEFHESVAEVSKPMKKQNKKRMKRFSEMSDTDEDDLLKRLDNVAEKQLEKFDDYTTELYVRAYGEIGELEFEEEKDEKVDSLDDTSDDDDFEKN